MKIRVLCAVLAVFTSLSACSSNTIPLGEYRIEWDPPDPKLVGQEIYFNEQMAYALLKPKDIEFGWRKEFIQIGRWIDSDGRSKGFPPPAYQREPIPVGTKLTVVSSFWHRHDWAYTEGDSRYLVVEDENGTQAVLSFYLMSTYSNREDLFNLRKEGEFKE